MKKIVAITGASGNMGLETVVQLMESDVVEKIKVLLLNERRERRCAKEWKRKYGNKIEVVFGDIAESEDCRKLVANSDYVLNLAAVIPPTADHYPVLTDRCNRIGAMNIVDSVSEIKENQPKLVHISTVAIYGNRNYKHPWGRVGDPLISSTYDEYSASKIKGERYVLDSDVKQWAVLRQTGMLHNRMLTNNMKDGLMFHTCFNAPIEWVTARDSGLLMRRLVEKDAKGELEEKFWKKCYNIGGGACAKNCPVGNIKIDENGKFAFGNDCVMCTRCSFNCPRDAFDIGILNGWRVNGKYSFKAPETPQKDKHTRYCKKAYARYFADAGKKIAANEYGV